MATAQQLTFDRYRVDLVNEQVWLENHVLPLTSKAFAVMRYLVEHTGQLVTKAELFTALWPGTAVSDGALTFCIVEIRKALGDHAKAPRFIETVHRRGYRFIGKVVSCQSSVLSPSPTPHLRSQLATGNWQLTTTLVGRETELTQLYSWLEKALNGERQLVFVTGEAGIGKTTLSEAFLNGVRIWELGSGSSPPQSLDPKSQFPNPGPWFARGQCIEQYGPGEPYMPILEALGRLGRESDGERLITLLHQHAPTWLVQMPTLLPAAELEVLQRKTAGATRERMLREMGEAIDVITAERPLVLWLEDLHWSDASTIELLALLARRREPARLLVIGTCRAVDVIVKEHPLRIVKQELQLHGLCAELPLGLLSEAQVAGYLTARFQVSSLASAGEPVLGLVEGGQSEGLSSAALQELARLIHKRTDGNPLFMVTAVEDLIAQHLIARNDGQWTVHSDLATAETRVPDSLQQLIERQLEQLSPEDQQLLEVASVAGLEFSAASVAAGLEIEEEVVEERCDGVARHRRFIRARDTEDWPDGTVAARYRFLHALYQEVLYNRVPAGRRQRLHQRIGERHEAAYGKQARKIATELAVHFERGHDYRKAVQYLQQAGENAVRRSAHQEAISHLTKGLELLKICPETPERNQQELRLLMRLGPALVSIKGYPAAEVEHTYARAYDLCQRDGRPLQLLSVLPGLQVFHFARGEIRKAREVAEQGWRLAQHVTTPTALMAGHGLLVEPLLYQGELIAAREHLEQAWVLYNPQEHNLHVTQSWVDPGVVFLSNFAAVLWLLGYPDQAQQKLQEGLALAERLFHPFSLVWALRAACWLYSDRREWPRARERAEEVIRLSTEHGFLLTQATVVRGVSLAEQGQVEEDIVQMQQDLTLFQATGAELARLRHLPWLAAAYGRARRIEDGLAVLTEALAVVENTGMRINEAELYRIKGELMLQKQSGVRGPQSQEENQKSKGKRQKAKNTDPRPLTPDPQGEAEACFHKAVEIAQHQQAKSLELRATMSLARLWQQQGKHNEARNTLSGIYGWFTEGFDTKDLQEAKALIEELSHRAIE